jgi:hypothetical protein
MNSLSNCFCCYRSGQTNESTHRRNKQQKDTQPEPAMNYFALENNNNKTVQEEQKNQQNQQTTDVMLLAAATIASSSMCAF